MSDEVFRYPSPQHPAKCSPPEPVQLDQAGLTIPPSMPVFARINDVTARFGLPRTRLYELMAAGVVDARKDGKATLVNVASVMRFISALPKAEIRLARTMARQMATVKADDPTSPTN